MKKTETKKASKSPMKKADKKEGKWKTGMQASKSKRRVGC